MEEDAYDVVALYTNSTELVKAKDYRRKDGKIDMCRAITELIEDGRVEGMLIGIKAMIETCNELGMSREDTLRQTVKKFDLVDDVVEGYMAEYWKN